MLGSENSDGLRGIYLDGCVIDEYANVNERLFPEIIRPALSDRKGYCVFIGTPQGMNNNFYELYQHAQGADDWFNYKAKASDTKIVDDEELQKADQKEAYLRQVVNYLEQVLRSINSRNFVIKNAIDWARFTSGAL